MKYFYGFSMLLLAPVAASAMSVIGFQQNPSCGLANGAINVAVSGGQPPYTYVWTPAPAIGQGTSQVSGLGPGLWSVTVTDDLGAQVSDNWLLTNQQVIYNVDQAYTWVYDNSAAHHPCPGFQNGSIRVVTSLLGGVPPYTVTVNGQPPLGYDINTGEPYFGYFSVTDQIYVDVTDANGCTGSGQVPIDSPQSLGATASNINPACGGLANGSAELTFGYAGPYGPALYIWDQTTSEVVFSNTPFGEPLLLTDLNAGLYGVVGTYSPIYFADPGCDYNASFTIPDLGPDCGTVSGRLFIDNNQNCVQNAGEPSVPYRVIEINPGPEYAITGAGGGYTRNLVNGNFTLEAQGTGTDLYPICPVVQPAPFTINYNSVTLDLADSSLIPLDLQVMAANTVARPGFAHTIWGDVRNLSTQLSGAATLTLTFDAQMSYVSASPVPTTISANTLTWDLPAFLAYGDQNFSVQLQVPPDAGLIGQPFAHTVSVTQPVTESTYANNSVALSGIYQGSYDPNDKQVFTSTREMENIYIIGADEWMDYVIRFQNTGTDTAFNIVVTDTLAAELDMASFQQGAASHPFTVAFKQGRVVEWTFPNILLPDSNVNEAASHGLVSFRIKPVLPLLPETLISNTANIFFDFNPPVITEPSVLAAEVSTRVPDANATSVRIHPNPASTAIRVVSSAQPLSSIRVMGTDGREIRMVPANSMSVDLDVSALSIGAYIIETVSNDGSVSRTRFIKQ